MVRRQPIGLDYRHALLPGRPPRRIRVRPLQHPAFSAPWSGGVASRVAGGRARAATDHARSTLETGGRGSPHPSDHALATGHRRLAVLRSRLYVAVASGLVQPTTPGRLSLPTVRPVERGVAACPRQLSLSRRAGGRPHGSDAAVVLGVRPLCRAQHCLRAVDLATATDPGDARRRRGRLRRSDPSSRSDHSPALAGLACGCLCPAPGGYESDVAGRGCDPVSMGPAAEPVSLVVHHRLRSRQVV